MAKLVIVWIIYGAALLLISGAPSSNAAAQDSATQQCRFVQW
jgi:hypothetical protein